MFQKKSHLVKIKINYHAQALKNQKKKKIKKKKRGNVNAQEKKSDKWQRDCPKKRGGGGNVADQGIEKKEKKMQLKLKVFV